MQMSVVLKGSGSAAIAAGAVLAGMSTQMPTKVPHLMTVGAALFLLGWTLYDTAVLLETTSITKRYLVVGFSVGVATSGIIYHITKSPFALIAFLCLWLALGICLGIDDDNKPSEKMWYSVPGSVFVILGSLSLALYQRKSCVVDGPGYALIGSAMTLLALV